MKKINEIREINAEMAEFLGWFLDDDHDHIKDELYRRTWFYKDIGIRVAWSYNRDGELNFHTSWESLMMVIEKIKDSLSTKTDLLMYNQLVLTIGTLNKEATHHAVYKFVTYLKNRK